MTDRLVLPARLDLDGAAALREALLARQGRALCLDGAAVVHLGAPGLEVLLAARALWEGEGRSLTLAPASEALRAGLARLGAADAFPAAPPARAAAEDRP